MLTPPDEGQTKAGSTIHWSSRSVPRKDQYAEWREACLQHVYSVTAERDEAGGAFRGDIDFHQVGSLDVSGVRCEGHRVTRGDDDIRRATSDTYYLYYQSGEGTEFTQRDRRFLSSRGDIVLADPNVACSLSAVGDFDFRLFRLPRASVDRYLAVPGHLPMIHLGVESAECALLSSCLVALWSHGDRLDARIAEPVAETLARLMAMTAGVAPEMVDAAYDAVRLATLERAVQYIAKHYADPSLTPAVAAKALGVSLRKLHLIFSTSGRTFGERVVDRRLEEARLLLVTPGTSARPIADIALEVGFNDLSTFYRAFRAKWGATPGDVRGANEPAGLPER
ncbi:MAG TPA: helix-turn-helix domain-containing protein [Polyangiaceae bacterium]